MCFDEISPYFYFFNLMIPKLFKWCKINFFVQILIKSIIKKKKRKDIYVFLMFTLRGEII